MVENLLILARVERGADVADVGPVLLQRILPNVLTREKAMWGTMTLTAEIPEGLPSVSGDEASIALVLRNLISNAGKYAGDGAHVGVTVTVEPAGEIAVRVRDDGPGIDPDEADRLFTLYFRSESTAAAPGSGIGLFVCRELIGAMGGRVWATAEPGAGAEFGFSLPLYDEADEREADLAVPMRPVPVEAVEPAIAAATMIEPRRGASRDPSVHPGRGSTDPARRRPRRRRSPSRSSAAVELSVDGRRRHLGLGLLGRRDLRERRRLGEVFAMRGIDGFLVGRLGGLLIEIGVLPFRAVRGGGLQPSVRSTPRGQGLGGDRPIRHGSPPVECDGTSSLDCTWSRRRPSMAPQSPLRGLMAHSDAR